MNPIEVNQAASKAVRILSNSGAVGSSKIYKGETFVYDGDPTGKATIPGEVVGLDSTMTFVKVSDHVTTVLKIDYLEYKLNGELTGSVPYTYIKTTPEDGVVLAQVEDDTWASIFPIAVIAVYDDTTGVELGIYVSTKETENNKYCISKVVLADAEEVTPIDPKYLPGTVINLCDYGINAYELIASGISTGKRKIGKILDFYNKIPRDGSRLVLVTNDGTNPIVFDQSATVITSTGGTVYQVATEIDVYMNERWLKVYLFITHNNTNGVFDGETEVYFLCQNAAINWEEA